MNENDYKVFFTWLLNEDVELIKEKDELLVESKMKNPYIYYPEKIYNFFETKPMKRLGGILQLGSCSITDPNAYHTRLEHCKGAYKNAVDFWVHNIDESKKQEYKDDQEIRLEILANIMDMARHDDGHVMMSHALEPLICNGKFDHEPLANRLLVENEEYKKCLDEIYAGLHLKMSQNSINDTSEFKFLREGNVDFDRMDYLMRDSMYLEIPYSRELIDDLISKCKIKKVEVDGELKDRPVYSIDAIDDIESFLEIRKKQYLNKYTSEFNEVLDYSLKCFCRIAIRDELEQAVFTRKAASNYDVENIEDIDLETHLETGDIDLYNDILKVYYGTNNQHLKNLIKISMPSLIGMTQIGIKLIDTKEKGTDETKYTKSQLDYIKSVKKVREDEELKKDLTTQYKKDNIVTRRVESKEVFEDLKKELNLLISQDKYGILYYTKPVKPYKQEEPLYIEDDDEKIKTFEKHSKVEMDLSVCSNYIIGCIPEVLRYEQVPEETIEKITGLIEQQQNKTYPEGKIKRKLKNSVNKSFFVKGKDIRFIGFEEELER